MESGKQDVRKVLAETVLDIDSINRAVLVFVAMLNDIATVEAQMIRVADHLPERIIFNRREWEIGQMADAAKHLQDCLEIVGNMQNNRDIASEPTIQLHKEAINGLDMIITKAGYIEAKQHAAGPGRLPCRGEQCKDCPQGDCLSRMKGS